jgi:hypothetical protein
MKKVLGIMLALVLTVAIAVPALANGVQTGVTIEAGGGNVPVVKCKWEETDVDPTKPGTQINPPGVFGGTVNVKYFVVVTDIEDGGDVGQTWVDVYHPSDWPDPDEGGQCGSFKYEIPLTRWEKVNETVKQQVLAKFTAADEAGLVTYAPGYNYSEVYYELDKCTADVWKGNEDLSYHQPAGNYTVEALCIDQSGNQSPGLNNTFEYVALSDIEIDFDAVNYGSTRICKEKWIAGDTIFDDPVDAAPDPNPATVRNIGNTDVRISVNQTDMGLDHTGSVPTEYQGDKAPSAAESNWNVVFDARLGSNVDNGMYYDPLVTVILPNKLRLCNTEELDFSIHIKKATAGESHTGNMTISCVRAEWDSCGL